MNLCDINDIKALFGRHGFHFSKSMGQNFLIDPQVPRDIAAASCAGADCCVLEIGPGIGTLTVELAKRAGKVVAVELDRTLLPILKETLAAYDTVTIVPGDILKLNLPTLIEEQFAGFTPIVCANLPYNITSPVLTALIESGCFPHITVMIQREVAARICAAPGSADYGSFSIFCQYHTKPQILFDVPPSSFLPAPKVTSSVVHMTARPKPDFVQDEAFFFRVVRAGFAQRRKTLVNSLSSALGHPFSREIIAQSVADCGLAPDIRGERLDLLQFSALSERLRQLV